MLPSLSPITIPLKLMVASLMVMVMIDSNGIEVTEMMMAMVIGDDGDW